MKIEISKITECGDTMEGVAIDVTTEEIFDMDVKGVTLFDAIKERAGEEEKSRTFDFRTFEHTFDKKGILLTKQWLKQNEIAFTEEISKATYTKYLEYSLNEYEVIALMAFIQDNLDDGEKYHFLI